ncbi:MAG TPA: isoleucine--tRNA ligase, partial [Clostridiales bacterium]|nr:isoleucine--tRNA ligase [Clostridiales bacterium]
DKWIISRLNTVVKTADSYLENYKITETAKLLQDFVDELSNWYVRRSRERFWVKGMPQDKINAYMTLYTVLTTFVKICAPMIPFMADDIYRNLVCSVDPTAPESVHLCDFPTAEESRIDTALEEEMELVLEIVVLGRAARNNANLKNRQPLRRMLVKADRPLDAFYAEIAAEELNVKEIEFTQDVSAFTSYSFKPQLKTLGPKYGKDLGKIRALLSELDGAAAMRELEESGTLVLDLGEKEAVLEKEDLLIDTAQKEGFETAADRGVTVVLETTLTPELIEEGFVRELISRIQTMRKEAGYEVLDHIVVYQAGSQEIKNYMMRNEPEIRAEVLAESVCYGEEFIPSDAYRKDWNINGFDTALAVRKIG